MGIVKGFKRRYDAKGIVLLRRAGHIAEKQNVKKMLPLFMLRSAAAFFPDAGFGYFHHYCQVCEPAFFSP
jgi:hypothetical protein